VEKKFDKQSLDKIISVHKLSEEDFLAINSHNFIEEWNLSTNQMIVRTFCEDECILYASDFRDDLVAAGTVFRQILLWEYKTGKIRWKLEGHTGVIFDVKFLSSD